MVLGRWWSGLEGHILSQLSGLQQGPALRSWGAQGKIGTSVCFGPLLHPSL